MEKPLHTNPLQSARQRRAADEQALRSRLQREARRMAPAENERLQASIMQAVDDCRQMGPVPAAPPRRGAQRLAVWGFVVAAGLAASVAVMPLLKPTPPAQPLPLPHPPGITKNDPPRQNWTDEGTRALDVVTSRDGLREVVAQFNRWTPLSAGANRLGGFDQDARTAADLVMAPVPLGTLDRDHM